MIFKGGTGIMSTHQLYIIHNGKDDDNRPNTIRLLDLIAKNLTVLGELGVDIQVNMMTDDQVPKHHKELKAKKITDFPAIIIETQPFMGYEDIYNIYSNEIDRFKAISRRNRDPEDDVDDYIKGEMQQWNVDHGDADGNGVGEGMSQDDIKAAEEKRRKHAREHRKPIRHNKPDGDNKRPPDRPSEMQPSFTPPPTRVNTPSSGGQSAEDIMLARMMENV